MLNFWRSVCVFTFTLSSFAGNLSAKAEYMTNLSVTITGLKNQKGQVCLSLFSSREGFPSNIHRAVQARCIKVVNNPVKVTFEHLAVGNYAVSAFHDAENDGVLHRNFLGIPTEEFGFSQNPVILTGPPNFADAAIFVAGSKTEIEIRLQSF